jgi:Mg-chelatase subunit ChlD
MQRLPHANPLDLRSSSQPRTTTLRAAESRTVTSSLRASPPTGFFVLFAASAFGCSPTSDSGLESAGFDPSKNQPANAAGQASSGGSASSPGAGGSSAHGAGAGPVIVIAGSPGTNGGASAGGGEVCQAESREGQRIPVDMYFLVDSSASMSEMVTAGSKWDLVSQSLIGFLDDPRNEGTGVGIGYFPTGVGATCSAGQPDCLCIPIINVCLPQVGGSCVVADYAVPAVALALPSIVDAVISNITAHTLAGGTPTRPAVEGALQYLDGWATQHPDRKVVLVLATDGDPLGCDANTPQDIAALAATALAGPHGIRTFVIGVGRSLQTLNLVAEAGGTGQAFLVDTGGDVAQQFADALDQIRGVASSCDFSIPTDTGSQMAVDPNKVNVRYTPTGSTDETLVEQTFNGDPANCGSEGGWYYDNPAAPTTITLCDATCSSLSGGSIHVEFGCDTIVQEPR